MKLKRASKSDLPTATTVSFAAAVTLRRDWELIWLQNMKEEEFLG